MTYSPLGAGFLTGKHQHGVQPGSRFDLVPGHQDVYFHDEAYRRLARLESVAPAPDTRQAHLALAWALHQPGVASVLVGGRTRPISIRPWPRKSLTSRTLRGVECWLRVARQARPANRERT